MGRPRPRYECTQRAALFGFCESGYHRPGERSLLAAERAGGVASGRTRSPGLRSMEIRRVKV